MATDWEEVTDDGLLIGNNWKGWRIGDWWVG